MLSVPGWQALPAPTRGGLWDKWSQVKSEKITLPASAKIVDMPSLHNWVRRQVAYTREAADVWQSPKETLTRHKGDCEDYAVLERAGLLALGYKEASIYVVVAYDAVTREDHAVTFCGDHFLDCRSPTVLHKSQFRDYRPIFAFQQASMSLFGRKL